MPNLRRLLVIPTRGSGKNSAVPPRKVQALADALNAARPHSILDLTDPYFNSASMHQALKQKFESLDPETPLIKRLVVDPPKIIGHEPDPDKPGHWIDTLSPGGGGVVYAIKEHSWKVAIRFR